MSDTRLYYAYGCISSQVARTRVQVKNIGTFGLAYVVMTICLIGSKDHKQANGGKEAHMPRLI